MSDTAKNGDHSKYFQTELELPFAVVPISQLTKGLIETEEKHLHARRDCENVYRRLVTEVRDILGEQRPSITPYDGVDHYLHVRKANGRLVSLRYRTGGPQHGKVALKSKIRNRRISRKEVEVRLDSEVSDEYALEFLREISSIGIVRSEVHLRTTGLIFEFKGREISGTMIEVVVSTCQNLTTGKMVAASEIEAHNFHDYPSAESAIGEYERQLGWQHLRTKHSMSRLVS